MDRIVIVKGDDLASLVDFMEAITTGRERAYQLRVTIDGDQVKLKVNGSTWTPGYGELDPECREAVTRAAQERGRAAARAELGGGGIGCFPPV